MKKPTAAQLRARLQNLIGRASSAYLNDRSACRASAVIEPLDEAFKIIVHLRRKDDPMVEARGLQPAPRDGGEGAD